MAILWTGEVGVLIVPAMLAVFRPSTAAWAALWRNGVVWRGVGVGEPVHAERRRASTSILGALGLTAVWMAWYRARHEKKRDGILLTGGVLGGVAVASLVFGAMQTAGEFSLSGVAQSAVGVAFALSLAGLAASLVMVPRRDVKWGAAAAAGLALASAGPSIAMSGLFGNTDAFTRTQAIATEIGRISLGARAGELRLSPNGSRFLIQDYDEDGDDSDVARASRFMIGAVGGGETRHVSALHAEFADDEHVLILQQSNNGLEMRLEQADSGVVWSASLPRMRPPTLSVSPHDHSWAVVADDPKGDSLVVVSGVFDKADFVVRRFAGDRAKGGGRGSLDNYQRFVVGERVILPELDMQRMSSPASVFGLRPRVELWEVSGAGRRQIGRLDGFPSCGSADDGYATCVVRSRFDRGQVWVIERTGPARFIGQIPLGEIGRLTIGPGGRISGAPRQGRVLEADAGAQRFADVHLPADSGSGFVTEVRTVLGRVAVLRYDNGGATLIFYRVP